MVSLGLCLCCPVVNGQYWSSARLVSLHMQIFHRCSVSERLLPSSLMNSLWKKLILFWCINKAPTVRHPLPPLSSVPARWTLASFALFCITLFLCFSDWVEGTRLSDRHRGWLPASHLETITNSRVRQHNLEDALKVSTATAAVWAGLKPEMWDAPYGEKDSFGLLKMQRSLL